MRLEHHLVGGYVRYISPHIIILLLLLGGMVYVEMTSQLQTQHNTLNVVSDPFQCKLLIQQSHVTRDDVIICNKRDM